MAISLAKRARRVRWSTADDSDKDSMSGSDHSDIAMIPAPPEMGRRGLSDAGGFASGALAVATGESSSSTSRPPQYAEEDGSARCLVKGRKGPEMAADGLEPALSAAIFNGDANAHRHGGGSGHLADDVVTSAGASSRCGDLSAWVTGEGSTGGAAGGTAEGGFLGEASRPGNRRLPLSGVGQYFGADRAWRARAGGASTGGILQITGDVIRPAPYPLSPGGSSTRDGGIGRFTSSEPGGLFPAAGGPSRLAAGVFGAWRPFFLLHRPE